MQEVSGGGVPKWGLEYLSPSFGYKGDQRDGVGRNKKGRVGGGGLGGRRGTHTGRKDEGIGGGNSFTY